MRIETESFCMLREKLTFEILLDIVKIYFEVVFDNLTEEELQSRSWDHTSPTETLKYIDRNFSQTAEFCLGSKLSENGKLKIWKYYLCLEPDTERLNVVKFEFDHNTELPNEITDPVVIVFRDKVNEYLLKNKLKVDVVVD